MSTNHRTFGLISHRFMSFLFDTCHYYYWSIEISYYLLICTLTLILLCKMNSKMTQLCGFIGLLFCLSQFARALINFSYLIAENIAHFSNLSFYIGIYSSMLFYILYPILPLLSRFEIYEIVHDPELISY